MSEPETLVEVVVRSLHRYYYDLKSADNYSDVDVVCYSVAQDVMHWIKESLARVSGGYVYLGACSSQVCFPLKEGGELRFCVTDSDVMEDISHDAGWDAEFDLYDGKLSGVGITGPVKNTG